MKPLKDIVCDRCGYRTPDIGPRKRIQANGSEKIYWAHLLPEPHPAQRNTPGISRALIASMGFDLSNIPIDVIDPKCQIGPQKCSVESCENTAIEMHHWAPKEIFFDADTWLVGPLCVQHHRRYHLELQFYAGKIRDRIGDALAELEELRKKDRERVDRLRAKVDANRKAAQERREQKVRERQAVWPRSPAPWPSATPAARTAAPMTWAR